MLDDLTIILYNIAMGSMSIHKNIPIKVIQYTKEIFYNSV